ncbi:ABC transporter substrate-binding protein [Paenibacillus filicis]|uniref:ABC transporter substrate-binding protein n=2 Tax=Paenibacillus filicis TaxID=669464 RepID=A0ABU9DCE4_9BACL
MFRLRLRHCMPVALVTLMTLLSACSGTQPAAPSAQPSASTAPPAAPAAKEEAATRLYKDTLGREVSIPTHPKRVMTTQYLPQMLAAGIRPIGASTHLLKNFASVRDKIQGIEDIGASNNPNLEKMLELKPDLIIVPEGKLEDIEKLNKIAPTVAVKWEGSEPFKQLRDVAEVLGQKEQAEQWIQEYNKKGEEARQKLASFVKPGETFGAVVIGGFKKGQLRVYGNGNVGYTLFETLKFPMTDVVKKEWDKGGNELGMNISLEKLPEFASADRLFVVRFDNDPEFLKEVESSRLWNNLPAVKNNKVYVVAADLWFTYDVLSFDAQLSDAIQLLSKP